MRPIGLHYSKTSSTSNTSATSSESGSIASTSYTEPLVPEAILQSAGKPLNDVINEVSKHRENANFLLSPMSSLSVHTARKSLTHSEEIHCAISKNSIIDPSIVDGIVNVVIISLGEACCKSSLNMCKRLVYVLTTKVRD